MLFTILLAPVVFTTLSLAAVVKIRPSVNLTKCLDVPGEVANGAIVQIYDCKDNRAQTWVVNSGASQVKLADTNLCLDSGPHPANNVRTQVWTCLEPPVAWQVWTYNADQQFVSNIPGQCLDLPFGSATNEYPVQMFQCVRGNTQNWTTTATTASNILDTDTLRVNTDKPSFWS